MSAQEERLLTWVGKARNGDEQAFTHILNDLEPDLRNLASRYYISGSDQQDVLQECRLGVMKAVYDFSEQGGMSFRNFAVSLCCRRHVITAMAAANRKKFYALNTSVSLDEPIGTSEEDGHQTLGDFIQDKSDSVLDRIVMAEEVEHNMTRLTTRLTKLESAILAEYSCDESYKEIADKLDTKPKTVDNGLMRIRKKGAEEYVKYQTDCEDA